MDKDYFEDLFETFQTPGWARIQDELLTLIKSINTLENVDTEQKLHHARGQLSAYSYVFNLPDVARQLYDQAKEDEKPDEETQGL